MKKISFFMVVAVLVFLGCVPSLHPLYNNSNTIFDADLIGQWQCDDPNWLWEFEKVGSSSNKNYKVKIKDEKDKEGIFDVHLVKIEDSNYLDLYPAGEPNWSESDFYKLHFTTVHTFMKIKPDPNGYQLSFMGGEKFNTKVKADPNIVKYEEVNYVILLTASTEQLIEFMKKYSNQEWVFSESFVISRVIPDANTDANNVD